MRFPRRNKIARSCDLDKNIKYRKILSFKPVGYWYSLGKEWYNLWYKFFDHKVTNEVICEIKVKKNMFTTLDKKEKGKILVIDSLKDVKKIFSLFGTLKIIEINKNGRSVNDFRDIKLGKRKSDYDDAIIGLLDFNKISENFSGIEFRNYKKTKKEMLLEIEKNKIKMFEYSWYDTLDVSSGCVWDLNLIEVEKKGKLKNFV